MVEAEEWEVVDIGLRLRLLPTVRLVPVSVVAFEGRLSGVLKATLDDEEERSVSRVIVTLRPRLTVIVSLLYYDDDTSGTVLNV